MVCMRPQLTPLLQGGPQLANCSPDVSQNLSRTFKLDPTARRIQLGSNSRMLALLEYDGPGRRLLKVAGRRQPSCKHML